MNKVILFGILASVLIMAAIGCGGLGSLTSLIPSTGNGTIAIVGTWKTTQITENNVSVGCPGTITGTTPVSCEAEVRTYTSLDGEQGTWQTTSPSDLVGSGSWTISNDSSGNSDLTVINSGAGTTVSGPITFSADTNTYYWIINGVTYQAARQ